MFVKSFTVNDLAEQLGGDSDLIRRMLQAEGMEPIGHVAIMQVCLQRSLPAIWEILAARPSCAMLYFAQPTLL